MFNVSSVVKTPLKTGVFFRKGIGGLLPCRKILVGVLEELEYEGIGLLIVLLLLGLQGGKGKG